MRIEAPLLAAAFLVLSCSYCYSDTVLGTTNNAAQNGYEWNMQDVLPPQAGLDVSGLIYRYTVEKNTEDDLQVHIQNDYSLGTGLIMNQVDDWSQLPGNTLNRMIPLDNIPLEYFGDGRIKTVGEGEVLDPFIQYTYRYDECYVTLSNPECPGYENALYDWLKENELLGKEPEVGDPFYDEWVQLTLNRDEVEEDDEDTVEIKDEEEDENDPIAALNAEVDIEGFVDGAAQAATMQALNAVPNIETYYTTNIPGGVYEEVLILEDATLLDNTRALNNLAQDTLHRDMVRSQYDNN